MNDIARVCNGRCEFAVSEIHQMVEVDCQILLRGDSKNPVGAIVAAGCSVIYVLRHKVHEQQRLSATRQPFRRDNA